jgi:glycosyltransferase involved in cell wall biosynthesis
MKPKILYTTSDASPQSGAFRSLLTMSRGIAGRGYEPVLALHREGRTSPLLTTGERERAFFLDLPRAKRGRPIGYYSRYIVQNIRSIYETARLLRQARVDIVHINEILDLYAGIASRIAGVPCVWHVRADLAMVPRLRWVLSRMVLTLADRVIAVSQSVHDRAFQGEVGQKAVVLHNPGPDPARFHPGVDGSGVRREFGLDDEAFLVTLVAKIVEPKGHDTLIRAAPLVLEAFPNTRFLVVGGELSGGHHRTYADALKSLAQELGVQDSILFTGFRSDIPQIMAASDIITHCSTYPDPFPGVVLQGMAVGKPVVASKLGGPIEQIENGASGILVDPGDSEALAQAVRSLLADAETRHALGSAAVARVESEFQASMFFNRLLSIYEEVLHQQESEEDFHL